MAESLRSVMQSGHSPCTDNPQFVSDVVSLALSVWHWRIGSIDNIDMSDTMHKRRLLMYHDKRFQMDAHFPLIAFNQEQLKNGTTGGYLMTEKHKL